MLLLFPQATPPRRRRLELDRQLEGQKVLHVFAVVRVVLSSRAQVLDFAQK